MPGLVGQPVQIHRLGDLQRHGVLDQALDRREAGAEREEDHRPRRILVQHEFAERTFHLDRVVGFQLAEQRFGEGIAGASRNLHLDVAVLARAAGNRVLPACPVGRQPDALPAEKTQALAARRQDVQRRHLRIKHLDRFHPGGELLHRNVARLGHVGLDHHVVHRRIGAQQDRPGILLGLLQHIVVRMDLLPLARHHARLALAAIAVAAAVIERHAVAQRRFQQGIVAFHEKLVAARLDGDVG